MAKSPRMVPGAESAGLVAPSILRPVTTAPAPSQAYIFIFIQLMSINDDYEYEYL